VATDNTTTLSWDTPDIVVKDINGKDIAGNFNFTNGAITIAVKAVPVTGVTVTGANSATTVAIGSTLQLSASITPANASNKTVTWSVTNGTGKATISSTGLLTGTAVGTVTVKAKATDGSGITGTETIAVKAVLKATTANYSDLRLATNV
jgi:uncharacterized protein YjdB